MKTAVIVLIGCVAAVMAVPVPVAEPLPLPKGKPVIVVIAWI